MTETKRQTKLAAAAAAGTAVAAAAGVGVKRLVSSRDGTDRSDSRAYRLLAGEPVGEGIKRIVLARADDALGQLRGVADTSPAEAVHEARKDLKKIRSAIRLVRKSLGDELYRRENNHYRDIGRELSGFRDAEVLVETLDGLQERFGEGSQKRFLAFRRALEDDLRERTAGDVLDKAMAKAAGSLELGRERVEAWPLDGKGWDLIGPGLHRTYRRGRKRLREVEEEASVATLHEWRKRVKDLWYQLRLIRDTEPELLGHLIRDADDLADHLGDDHDLALLRAAAVEQRARFESADEQRLLLELIDHRRGELQFAAISLGQRLYGDKPKRFLKRMERRWNASPLSR